MDEHMEELKDKVAQFKVAQFKEKDGVLSIKRLQDIGAKLLVALRKSDLTRGEISCMLTFMNEMHRWDMFSEAMTHQTVIAQIQEAGSLEELIKNAEKFSGADEREENPN